MVPAFVVLKRAMVNIALCYGVLRKPKHKATLAQGKHLVLSYCMVSAFLLRFATADRTAGYGRALDYGMVSACGGLLSGREA